MANAASTRALPAKRSLTLAVAPALGVGAPVYGQGSSTDLAKNLSNPIASLIRKLVKVNEPPISLTGELRNWAAAPDDGPEGHGVQVGLTVPVSEVGEYLLMVRTRSALFARCPRPHDATLSPQRA
ncbi:hypothetical protein [Rhizobium leguminosarum]|uniref:hypothetical protein n=1 Tax=Rhizobium leguminosarum TaxID=384 RepID=UPI001C915802|nr:hypothetical protein [Rhizobium leguminosarum]MBY2919129.1 hypothetical protein [Rhizobium leguminosarum]MBY2974778.1 hypothetical protein [Rhizobium leguminosarum]MBY2982259.1 hypothetical protein [Rhizobium leguminosarum]MBY3010727.1 hypothetical protein [Rhizobium leguminosarum]